VAQEVLPRAEELGTPELVNLHRTVGACRLAQANLADAEKHFRAAVRHSLTAASLYNQALAYQDLGVCLRAQGRMEEVDEVYHQSLKRWRAVGSPGPIASILNNLAMGPFLRGDFRKAEELLHEAWGYAETSLSPNSRAVARASFGDLYRDRGDFSSAWQVYQEGLELARQARNATLTSYLLEALGNLAREQGALLESRQYLQDALEAAGSSRSDRSRVQVSLSLLELAGGQPEKAGRLLEEAVPDVEQGGERLQLLRTRLAQAIVWHHLGLEEAREAFDRATVLAQEMNLIEPFLAEAAMLQPHLPELLVSANTPFLDELYLRVQSRPSKRVIVPGEKGQVHLCVLALGPGRVFRGESEIGPKEWGGGWPRELFFYLLFHAPVRREEVGLLFWPDRDSESLTTSFHTLLYRARQAIGSRFAIFRDGAYHWNPQVTYWSDVEAFEQILDQAENLHPDSPRTRALLTQAVDLYQGDFLEEFDSAWCEPLRQRLRGRYLRALMRLGEIYIDQREFPRAEAVFEAALASDDLCEEAYRGLMRCFSAAGQRTRALQVYRDCCRHLSQALDVLPSDETQALHRAIAHEAPLPSATPSSRPDPRDAPGA
jgi:two-component SAPR family response regulator